MDVAPRILPQSTSNIASHVPERLWVYLGDNAPVADMLP